MEMASRFIVTGREISGNMRMDISKWAPIPLDLDGLLRELDDQPDTTSGMHPDTTMGHMHLHVAHLDAAEAFYRDVLGFDLILRYGPSASFLAAGGYHHHIGLNTWAGIGAPSPPPHSTGLAPLCY